MLIDDGQTITEQTFIDQDGKDVVEGFWTEKRRDSARIARNVRKAPHLYERCEGLSVRERHFIVLPECVHVRSSYSQIRNRLGRYSYRNATMGSTFVARRAGM